MKAYKICLFLISVFALLGLLCLLIPAKGITLFGTTINAPDLGVHLVFGDVNNEYDPNEAESVQNDSIGQLSADEMFAENERRLREAARDSAFRDFCENSPIRIQMPYVYDSAGNVVGQNLHYFETLFDALDNANQQHVRIIHYGDSQIEEDRITAFLREQLQSRFGGGGPGMQPATTDVSKLTVIQSASAKLPRFRVYGAATNRASHHNYGPMGQFQHLGNQSVTITLSAIESEYYPHNTLFDKVTLVTDKGIDTVQTNRDGNKVSFSVKGPADIYGVLLDSDKGVSVDNIPMRGCTGAIFTSITKASLKPFFDSQNVRLIIMQYGGNMVPGLKSEERVDKLCESLKQQIVFLQQFVPDAKILFIGPSDMSTKIKGKWATYPILPYFTWMLANSVNEAGAAYWDMYTAMGGEGSMIDWVSRKPPLAGQDYVHFTHRGADRVASMLTETLFSYYKYYKHIDDEVPAAIISDSNVGSNNVNATSSDSL